MRRRALLASTAATLATTAGCLSGETRRATADEQTRTDQGQTSRDRTRQTQTARTDLPVAAARVRTSIRWVHTVDAVEVSAPDNDAFVAVRVPEALRGPEPDAFELRLEDTVYRSVDNGVS
ncbi:hypothetical protein RYH80_17480 [Halobaculum sp. MBLA0147]|uniref:hypothetical protein n=1 Tax=Halobaculum sp. MBLA0147 TaxID=3079934 RepID=UPI0035259DCC